MYKNYEGFSDPTAGLAMSIVECPPATTVDEICARMATVPSWAPGLILRADGYECPGFYQKS